MEIEGIMETAEIKSSSDKAKAKKQAAVIAAVVIAVLAVAVYLAFRLLNKEAAAVAPMEGSLLPPGFAQDGPLPNMNAEEIRKQMQMMADASYFSFKINSRPVFQTGNSAGTLQIENPSYNLYPMVVQIFLDDTQELIYDSGGILPNQHVEEAKLKKRLAAGTYNATAYLNAYDPENHSWLGKQAAALVITVNT